MSDEQRLKAIEQVLVELSLRLDKLDQRQIRNYQYFYQTICEIEQQLPSLKRSNELILPQVFEEDDA